MGDRGQVKQYRVDLKVNVFAFVEADTAEEAIGQVHQKFAWRDASMDDPYSYTVTFAYAEGESDAGDEHTEYFCEDHEADLPSLEEVQSIFRQARTDEDRSKRGTKGDS